MTDLLEAMWAAGVITSEQRAEVEGRLDVGELRLKDIARLSIHEGDTLCVWFDEIPRNPETGGVEHLQAYFDKHLPDGTKLMVFEGNVGLRILSPEQVQDGLSQLREMGFEK
jgi:hypothetical protein